MRNDSLRWLLFMSMSVLVCCTGNGTANNGPAAVGAGGTSSTRDETGGAEEGGSTGGEASESGGTRSSSSSTTTAPGDASGGEAGTEPNGTTECGSHRGFWVDGRVLRDRCCEKVVLRGVSEMVTWSSTKDGTPYFSEIAKTGANVVRIVWLTTNSAAQLEAAIENAIDAQLIPMPELHDATGDLSKLAACVDYWVEPDVVSVLQKYEDKLLINIANEVGDGNVARADWTSEYNTAVERMRTAGIHAPLIIDAPSWGQDINMLQAAGPAILAADPDKNLLFSVHMWWTDPQGTKVKTELEQSVTKNLPLIVGEFAQHNVSGCSAQGFAYKTLMSEAQRLEVGWLAWSWGGVKNGDCAEDEPFDMTTDGTFDGLTGWGQEVAVTDPNSIKETSVRPRYMTSGSCE